MAMKDFLPRRSGKSASERMRGLIEPIERFIENPWAGLGNQKVWCDIRETPKEIVVWAILPGWSKDDVQVDVSENTVTINGNRTKGGERRSHGMKSHERSSESFVQRIALPTPIKVGEAKAEFKDDALEIHLPRVKEAEIRRVDIQ